MKFIEDLETKIQHVKEPVKNYLVDTSAALGFWTPIMASSEYFLADMDGSEVFKSRLGASVVHMTIARPYGKLRQWIADSLGADAQSSLQKKFAIDTFAMICTQTPLYSSILYLSGASKEEIFIALPTGLTIGAVSGRAYGYSLDLWRRVWGARTTF